MYCYGMYFVKKDLDLPLLTCKRNREMNNNRNLLHGNAITSVYSKFFFRLDKLCYRVILSYGDDSRQLYKDFDNFQQYHENHEAVVDAIKGEGQIPNTFSLLTT